MWEVNQQVHRSVNIFIHGQSFLSAGILLCIPHKQVLRQGLLRAGGLFGKRSQTLKLRIHRRGFRNRTTANKVQVQLQLVKFSHFQDPLRNCVLPESGCNKEWNCRLQYYLDPHALLNPSALCILNYSSFGGLSTRSVQGLVFFVVVVWSVFQFIFHFTY